jgi:hypothetical protein
VGGVLVGRATAQQAVAPPASPALASSPRFQYKCLTGVEGRLFKEEALAVVNQEGAKGWRFLDGVSAVHMSGMDQYCFERVY